MVGYHPIDVDGDELEHSQHTPKCAGGPGSWVHPKDSMKSNDVSQFSTQYGEALRTYLDPEGPGADLRLALDVGALAVDAGLETLDVAKIHDIAMMEFVPAEVPISVRADFRLRASVFFTEAITPIERTHRSAVEAEQQIAQASDTLAQSSVELADSQHELQNGITLREAAEAALQSSRDTFETLLKESRLLEVYLREVTRESLTGQEEERRRVSRQLHDDISQAILGIHVRLLVLKKEIGSNHEGLSREIIIAQGLLEESVESINRLTREFSAPND